LSDNFGSRGNHELTAVTVDEAGVDRLKPNAVGLRGVIFVAVTGAAPILAMLFNVPFAAGFGTGIGTPGAFLFATVILTIFSVGYVAMARKIRAAGGFYSFISHGLGRELGMATGICGAIAYSLFEVSLLGGFAYFANSNFDDWFGWDIPWPLFALGAALLISVLCWFDVELSVRVLGVAPIGEIIILTLFDILVIGQNGSTSGLAWGSMNPLNAFDDATGLGADGKAVAGAAGVGLFLAFWSWVGFEAPRTTPRSRATPSATSRARR
jgi:amino acid transporter